MRKNWRNSLLIVGLLSLFFIASCEKGNDHTGHQDTYTCPMHPTVISDKPGTCPVCGMDLVRKARPGEELKIADDLAGLLRSPNETVVSSVKTILPEYKTMPITIEASGKVSYDTRNMYTIPTRVAGRVEKLYAKYEFQPVKKGQKIADIYSPELATAQRELLYLVKNDVDNVALIEASKKKLHLLGLSSSEVEKLLAGQQSNSVFSVFSPYDGYVITNADLPSIVQGETPGAKTADMEDGMGSSGVPAPSSGSPTALIIREGNYVAAGQTLIKVVNTNDLRIDLQLSADRNGMIMRGDKIQLDLGTGRNLQTTVDFVQPFFSEGENFLRVRIYVPQENSLRVGQLVRATLQMNSPESLWIPKEAVVDLGNDKVVFVKVRQALKPRKVGTGLRTDKWIEVKDGLSSSDEIAANAYYLVDSESFIKPVK